MFANFIYFIIALLITVTYRLTNKPDILPRDATILFLGLLILFASFIYFRFKRLETRISIDSYSRLDFKFNSLLTNSSILAVILLAIDIYGLKLPYFIENLPIIAQSPTLLALIFLILFIGYLVIIWFFAYGAYQKIYKSGISQSAYVISYLKFSVPILLPWLTLAGIADIINALPFEAPKNFLFTTQGQMIYFLFFVFLAAIIAPAIIQRIWGCKPLEQGNLRNRIEDICRRAGVQYSDILYWPIFGGRMITAGVMGLIRKFRYILVTDALLRLLDPVEIDAVISHEVGHVKKKHLIFYIFFFIGMLPVIGFAEKTSPLIFSFFIQYQPINQFFNMFPSLGIFMENLFLIILAFLIYFRFVFGFFMRNFERQADCYVFHLFDTSVPLITTLKKINLTSRTASDRPNWHHFSIKERIDYLRKCEHDRSWITRQDWKIRKGIAIYIMGIILVLLGVQYLNTDHVRERIDHFIIENLPQDRWERMVEILEDAMEKDPTNPMALGGFGRYFQKDCKSAINAYEKALTAKPNDPWILNNLAWFYATCNNLTFRNPSRALELSKKALELANESFILDTLAESYYVNGLFQEAVETEKEALRMAKSNRSHYKEQLKKFKEALKTGGNK